MNPITLSLVVVALLGGVAVLAFAVAVARAAEGYEDETGFHLGRRPSAPRLRVVRSVTVHPHRAAPRQRVPREEPVSVG
jgi:hypothetical protein